MKPPYIFYFESLGQITKSKKRSAIALWPFILIAKDKNRSPDKLRTLIEHEKVHHRQQLRGLFIGFYIKYVYYNFKYKYDKNPYEVEAYLHHNDWKK